MKLCDILVHLDGSPRAKIRLDLAVAMARRHEAHLTALHVIDVAMPALALGDGGGGGAVIAELMEQMRQSALATGAQLQAAFQEAIRREGVMGEWRQTSSRNSSPPASSSSTGAVSISATSRISERSTSPRIAK